MQKLRYLVMDVPYKS